MSVFITEAEFYRRASEIPYYQRNAQRRWGYMSKVLEEAYKCQFETVLELGAYKICMTKLSDNMDLFEKYIDVNNRNNKMYIQDITTTPWEIEDDFYDLMIAQQVFEHLEGKQRQVFREIQRVGLQAIISVPYMWNCPEDINHHMITDEIISEWTDGYQPYRTHVVNNRKILCYRF